MDYIKSNPKFSSGGYLNLQENIHSLKTHQNNFNNSSLHKIQVDNSSKHKVLISNFSEVTFRFKENSLLRYLF